jgi:hypothetical protein
MIPKSSCAIIFLLGAAPIGWTQVETVTVAGGMFVPAGTLIGCTLDEPNFSSQTSKPGDPVLCKTNSVEMFGRSLIPRGAYLSARFRNYRDPGHFVGKGWIQLEFTKLTLPGGSVSLDAKVISAARYRVNGDGKIQGRGHAKRDAVEWAIPILWPVKVLTLPARGPRPALKGETRIEVRLMEDLVIPESAYAASGLTTRPAASQFRPDRGAGIVAPLVGDSWSDSVSPPPRQPLTSVSVTNRGQLASVQPRLTVLVLRGGRMYMVADYWVEKDNLNYRNAGGPTRALPLDSLDLPMTRQLNAERGVPFVLAAKGR